jgi:2-amino-4-hydroxy-6-hydroxymethyldihydropteridine diphosphokinase
MVMDLETKTAYLLLGSNLGDRENYLREATRLIGEQVGEIVAKSAVYETAAWGKTDQPGFLNLALAVETKVLPLALLDVVLNIEQSLGRRRLEKWGARLIDIDIILYGNEVIDDKEQLQIPHPEMQHRKFVLVPMVEIAPNLVHPVLKKSLSALLDTLADPLPVTKLTLR